ncbi:MAG: hypothetical protein ISR51_01465 [Rhodospirillales bacterium]|nr:hypothetical protein [Alphaproteobacteria bacterium]MBL6947318.1 hypothetical protein [Rhodospirillales bacterium]
MSEYDFAAWLESQIGQDFEQIRDDGLSKAAVLELTAKGITAKIPGLTRNECADLAERIKRVLVFIEYNVKPNSVSAEDWEAYRPLCEALVNKQQMKPESLALFD